MLVELTRTAEADIGDAAVAYELERPGLGFRFEEEVDRVLAAIAENPRQYQVVSPDVRRGLVRVFPYSVYFTSSSTAPGSSRSCISIAIPTRGKRAIDDRGRRPTNRCT